MKQGLFVYSKRSQAKPTVLSQSPAAPMPTSRFEALREELRDVFVSRERFNPRDFEPKIPH
jgi:hypothetical protein